MDAAVQRRAWQENVSLFSLPHRAAVVSAASLRLRETGGVSCLCCFAMGRTSVRFAAAIIKQWEAYSIGKIK